MILTMTPLLRCFHVGVNKTGQVDIAKHLQLPGVTPCPLVDLLKRASGNVAGIIDENIDTGRFRAPADEDRPICADLQYA